MHTHLSIEDVEQAMTTNQYEFAIELCGEILKVHHFDDLSNQARHQRAIALRLLKRYIESTEEFEMTICDGLDDHFLGRVMRDYGMLGLEQGDLDQAEVFILESIRLLDGDEIEQAVSRGFLGRVVFLKTSHSMEAVAYLGLAQRVLHKCGNDNYELNNLIWFMKVLTPIGRLKHLGRALRLSWRQRTSQRAIEALLITISPKLYEKIKNSRA